MPSGRTHDRITFWTLPIATGLTLILTGSAVQMVVVGIGFLFGGLMLGPDLDTHSIHYKRWGYFRWIWLPYRGSLRHRSPLSHAPIVGTLLRVIYLMIWVGLFGFLCLIGVNELGQLGWTWSQVGDFWQQTLQQNSVQWLALLIGLELGALSHYTADWGVSAYKRSKKQGWRAFIPFGKQKKRRSRSRSRRKPASGKH